MDILKLSKIMNTLIALSTLSAIFLSGFLGYDTKTGIVLVTGFIIWTDIALDTNERRE